MSACPTHKYGEELVRLDPCALPRREPDPRRTCAASAVDQIAHYKVPALREIRRRLPDDRHGQGAEVLIRKAMMERLGLANSRTAWIRGGAIFTLTPSRTAVRERVSGDALAPERLGQLRDFPHRSRTFVPQRC